MKHTSPTLLLLLLLAWACSSPSDPAVAAKKDCNAEYQEMSSTPFASTTQALKRVDTYLNEFNNTDCPHLDDAQRLKELFEEMDLFFHNRQYDSYHAYLTAAQEKETHFLNSGYPAVRTTWLQLYENDKKTKLQQALNDLTAESFMAKFKESAEGIAQDEYCGNGPFAWEVTSSEIIDISTPVLLTQKNGKQCQASVRVHISGPLGWRSGAIKIQLIGQLLYNETGMTEYTLVDYSVSDRTGNMPIFSSLGN